MHVCIWRCEHAVFCVDLFMCKISLIHAYDACSLILLYAYSAVKGQETEQFDP